MKKTLNEVLEGYVVYFAGDKGNLASMDIKPFGKELQVLDIYNKENRIFFDLLNQLDGISYGNKSLAMDKWVSLDCGLLPSGFVGLAKKVADCPKEILEKYNIPKGYTGLVPITEYCAIPSAKPGYWVSHTCATIIKGENLGLISKILGLKIFNIKKYYGIAQYLNNAVKSHSKFGKLLLKSALTPAHSDPENTFIYEQTIDQSSLSSAYESEKEHQKPDLLIDPTDLSQKEKLQELLSSGKQVYIISPGQVQLEGKIMIPISFG